MRSRRKITVKLVESERIHNQRLIEYFVNKFKERKIENVRYNAILQRNKKKNRRFFKNLRFLF